MYIDLNQIAAQEAETPEASSRTSAYLRIQGRAARQAGREDAQQWDGFLAPLHVRGDGRDYAPAGQLGSFRASDGGILDVTLDDYLSLLDWVKGLARSTIRGPRCCRRSSGMPRELVVRISELLRSSAQVLPSHRRPEPC